MLSMLRHRKWRTAFSGGGPGGGGERLLLVGTSRRRGPFTSKVNTPNCVEAVTPVATTELPTERNSYAARWRPLTMPGRGGAGGTTRGAQRRWTSVRVSGSKLPNTSSTATLIFGLRPPFVT